MKILFLSYSDVRYDGRLRELLAIADEIGEVCSVIRFNRKDDSDNYSIKESGLKGILQFIKEAKSLASHMKQVDILFLDNRMACIPGLLLKRRLKNTIIIQDVRELYILWEQTRIKSMMGCMIEKKMIEKSDVIICANIYRAKKMMKIYSLQTRPLVYENIRKLSYEASVDIECFHEKYHKLFRDGTINIISTSGCDVTRTNDQLIKEMKNVEGNVALFVVGGGSKKDQCIIDKIVKVSNLKNIYFINKVEESELKYLINQCQIGIVNYGQYDTNNRLCASGKMYEFIFEGLPIVATANRPLKDFCEKNKVGVAGVSYSESINEVIRNYDVYKKNVLEFIKKYDVNCNNQKIIEKLKKRISKDI